MMSKNYSILRGITVNPNRPFHGGISVREILNGLENYRDAKHGTKICPRPDNRGALDLNLARVSYLEENFNICKLNSIVLLSLGNHRFEQESGHHKFEATVRLNNDGKLSEEDKDRFVSLTVFGSQEEADLFYIGDGAQRPHINSGKLTDKTYSGIRFRKDIFGDVFETWWKSTLKTSAVTFITDIGVLFTREGVSPTLNELNACRTITTQKVANVPANEFSYPVSTNAKRTGAEFAKALMDQCAAIVAETEKAFQKNSHKIRAKRCTFEKTGFLACFALDFLSDPKDRIFSGKNAKAVARKIVDCAGDLDKHKVFEAFTGRDPVRVEKAKKDLKRLLGKAPSTLE